MSDETTQLDGHAWSTEFAYRQVVRVRIVKELGGVVDGLPLSTLIPGITYELSSEVADHLIQMRSAVQARSTDPPTNTSFEDIDIAWLTGGVHVVTRDTAHDREP